MFSGLVEAVGTVGETARRPDGLRMAVTTALGGELVPGESIAVNGVCLTVVTKTRVGFVAEVSPETVRVTTLGQLEPGHLVNLERSLKVDARLGGHFVLGHVDGVGQIAGVEQQSDFFLVTVTYPERLESYFVLKGSIAVDGISLTIADVRRGEIDVQIVPFTWDHTNLHAARPDDAVNLECDIIGKYVVKAVRATT
jgi:riboflavin synthase